MADLNACKKPDGSYDWEAFSKLEKQEKEERKAKGQLCSRCGMHVSFSGNGSPQRCYECKALDEPDELHHGSNVRCPKCGHHWQVGDGDYYELYEDGEHEVSCPDCDHAFEMTTWVKHTFISPARIKPECTCTIDGTTFCKAKGTGYCKAETITKPDGDESEG